MKLVDVITTSTIELTKPQFDYLRGNVRIVEGRAEHYLTQSGVVFFYRLQEHFNICNGPTLTRKGFNIVVVEGKSIKISEIIPDMRTHKEVVFTIRS